MGLLFILMFIGDKKYLLFISKENATCTVLPAKSDSDVIFCLQLLS